MTTTKQIQADLEKVNAELTRLKANLDETKAKLSGTFLGSEAFNKLTTSIEKMEATIKRLETKRINIGRTEFNELNKAIETSSEKIKTLQREMARLNPNSDMAAQVQRQIDAQERFLRGRRTLLRNKYDAAGNVTPWADVDIDERVSPRARPVMSSSERYQSYLTKFQHDAQQYDEFLRNVINRVQNTGGFSGVGATGPYTHIPGGAGTSPAGANMPVGQPTIRAFNEIKGLDNVSENFKRSVRRAIESLRETGIDISEIKFLETEADGIAKLSMKGVTPGEKVNEPFYQNKFIDVAGRMGKSIEDVQRLQFRADARNKELFSLAKAFGFNESDLHNIRGEGAGGYRIAEFRQDRPGAGQYRQSFRVNEEGIPSLSPTTRRFQTFGQSVGRDIVELTKWSLAISAIYGPINALSTAMQQLIENEAKLADVSIALDSSVSSTNQTFDDIYDAAKGAGESVSGVIDAFGQAYRAAGRITDANERYAASIKLLDSSLVLSKLSTLDQAGAIDTLTAALYQAQGTNDSAASAFDNATNILDEWVKVSKVANVDIATLATGVAVLGDSAEAAGLSLQQLNALVATIAETSISGGKEAANIAKALVGNYQQPEAIRALSRIGIAVTDVTGKNREFLAVMQDVAALRQSGILGDQDLAKVAQQLGGGGVRRGADVARFIENFSRMEQIVGLQSDAAGESSKALAIQLETVQTSATRLGNAFTSLAQSLGNEGGLLDVFSTGLNIATSFVEVLDKLAGAAGKVSPLLLGLGTAALALKLMGSDWRTAASNNIAQPLAQFGGGDIFTRQTRQAKITKTLAGENALGWYGGVALATALPAAQNLLSGNTEEAAGNVFGGIAGAAIGTALGAAGGPIGALIGAAIGEAFVRTTLTYEGTFKDLFAPNIQNFPEATGTGTGRTEVPPENLMFQALGGVGGESWGRFRSWFTQLSSQQTLGERLLGRQPETYANNFSAGLALLDKENPELARFIRSQGAARSSSGGGSLLEISPLERRQQALATPETEALLRSLQEGRQTGLRNQLITGELKPSDYQAAMGNLATFTIGATRSMAALVDEAGKLPEQFSSAEEAYAAFLDVAGSGNETLINQINSQASAIEYYESLLETWQPGVEIQNLLSGGTFIPKGMQEIQDLLSASRTGYANALQYGAEQANLQNLKLTPVIGSNITPRTPEDVDYIVKQTQKYQNIRYQELDPKMYEALKKSFEDVSFLIKDGGKLIHKSFSELDQNIMNEVIQQAEKEGKISSAGGGGGLGFSTIGATKEQLLQAERSAPAFIAKYLTPLGYESEVTDAIYSTSEQDIVKTHGDQKIIQYLLQQILDTEKKQLEGMYNLPEGATFWVPITGAWQAKGPSGGGGIPEDWLKNPEIVGEDPATTAAKAKSRMANYQSNMDIRTEARDKLVSDMESAMFKKSIVDGGYSEGNARYPGRLTGTGLGSAGTGEASTFSTALQALNQSLNNLGPSLNNAIINVLRMLPGMSDFRKGVDTGSTPDARGLGSAIRGSDAPTAMTKFDIRFSSTTQLMVDGRTLATIIKPYLASDLMKTNETGGTVTRTFVI